MNPSATAGRHIEIIFAEADRVLEVDLDDEDPALACVIADAIDTDDPDDAERRLRTGTATAGTVYRRP